MSWSKGISGLAAVVIAAAASWPAEVEAADTTYSASDDVKRLHKAQAEKVASAVKAFAEAAPEGYAIAVSAHGHAAATTTAIQSDQWGLSISASKPAPALVPSIDFASGTTGG